jgi:penicillin G amidase
MSFNDPTSPYADTSGFESDAEPEPNASRRARLWLRIVGSIFPLLVILATIGWFYARHYVRTALQESLPQIDGTLSVPGLTANVTVDRDAHGVPHIRAASLDDLVFAQGYVTAQDRLWQMDTLRRHAAGELAEVLGSSLVEHDKLQRTLQVRTTAERALAVLPKDQLHWLEVYAQGVNASMEDQRAHLPLEFILLRYQPAPWTPRDTLLVELAMFQDLTTGFPTKLSREALAARLPPELMDDLYPTGSWRDHTPDQVAPDLTAPQPEIEDVPLDESQTKLHIPTKPAQSASPEDLDALNRALSLFHPPCPACVAGSNNWAVAGSRTASGKPILSNDMHLNMSVPSLWYEADLEAPLPSPPSSAEDTKPAQKKSAAPKTPTAPETFHVAGVTLPGAPFVIVGHNTHVAWGFTNLGGDVQDVYIEHTRGEGTTEEFQSADGAWHPMLHHTEVIHVRGKPDVNLDVALTQHGTTEMPVISAMFPDNLPTAAKRTLSLRWTVYDPNVVTAPFFAVDSAHDWPSMLDAFSTFGGPSQNMVYADDQGHIGYHAVGRIPIRGAPDDPSPLAPVPIDMAAPDAASHEWAGYVPYEQLPQVFDPPEGVLATANARVTPAGYPLPVTLNWDAPYRTERIYKVLQAGHKLTPADMLALEMDTHSTLDQVIAQRLTYSIDHTTGPLKNNQTLREAADILRTWNGDVSANSQAAAIVNAARAELWPMLLTPKLKTSDKSSGDLWHLYVWGERSYVEEEMVMHAPARWLPPGYATWEDFLAAVADRGLRDAHAPHNLATFMQGSAHPLDVEHPIYAQSPLFGRLIGQPIGTGPQHQGGDSNTVKQALHLLNPSERFTVDLSDLDKTTLNIPIGQSGSPASPWFLDQFPAWLHGTTFALPFTPAAVQSTTAHSLTLTPAP